MIYILAGENTFASRHKAREIYDRFTAVAGGADAAVRVSVPTLSLADMRAVLETGSLFREKRLVVLEGATEGTADVTQFLIHTAPALAISEDIFLFFEGESTTDGSLMQALREHATKVQEFKKPSVASLASWVDAQTKITNTTLSLQEKQQVVERARGNMWRLAQEFEKAALTPAHMREHGNTPAAVPNIFSFTDAFGGRRRRDAVLILHQLLRGGVNAERIFFTLLWHMRALASVRDLVVRGDDGATIAKKTTLHPFVVKKNMTQSRAFTAADVARFYRMLADLDIEVKQNRADLALGLERIVLCV